jgi:cytochrome c
MNSFELNKILGAVLGCCLVLVAMHIASGAIFTPVVPAKPGYVIEVSAEQPAQGAAAAPAEVPIETLLASASPQAGESGAKVCLTCHNMAKGQGSKVGPDLYGVVGRAVASVAGFNYSSALKAVGGNWTFDSLNKWLTNPRGDVPGTLMTFAGISSEKQRADIIVYLNSDSDSPLPLPQAAQAAPAPAPAAAPTAAPAATPAAPPAQAAPPPASSPPAGSPPAGQSSAPQ